MPITFKTDSRLPESQLWSYLNVNLCSSRICSSNLLLLFVPSCMWFCFLKCFWLPGKRRNKKNEQSHRRLMRLQQNVWESPNLQDSNSINTAALATQIKLYEASASSLLYFKVHSKTSVSANHVSACGFAFLSLLLLI